MMNIDARKLVGNEFPPEEGAKLAKALLERQDVAWDELTIELDALPAALLISAFFNGFLQKIFDSKPELLDSCRVIKWRVNFDFQRENIDRWMKDFKPREST